MLCVLSACVFVPVVNENDPESANCQTFTKSMFLSSIQLQGTGRCQNQNCAALLASAAVVSAGSAIISGSIVLTDNTLHWLEYQGTCSDGYLNRTRQLFLDSLNKK
jgi:hypothetical protein